MSLVAYGCAPNNLYVKLKNHRLHNRISSLSTICSNSFRRVHYIVKLSLFFSARELHKHSQKSTRSSSSPESRISSMNRTLQIMAAFVKLFIVSVIVASMIVAPVNCEKASGRRLLQTLANPPQAESLQLVRIRPRPGCSLGPVCPPGNTIICENDEETGETGGCICTLVHLCHPERKNCTFYGDRNATGTPCGF